MEIDLSRKILRHMGLLMEIAIASPKVAGAKIAAMILYKNRVVSVGVNTIKTSPFQAKFSSNKDAIFLHAETAAIKNAIRNVGLDTVSKSTLLVCRVKSADWTPDNFVWGMARPCKGCQRAISQFGIRKVYYTAEAGIEML